MMDRVKTVLIAHGVRCQPGHFGTDCSKHCSEHSLKKEPCDHVSGVCPSRKEDGYTGEYCQISNKKKIGLP